MCRRRRRSRHSGDFRPGYSGPSRPARRGLAAHGRLYGVLGGLAVIALAAAFIVLRNGGNAASGVSLNTANCDTAHGATADASSGTLLGVDATSPCQLKTATAEFGHQPVLRVYYTGMPAPAAWRTGHASSRCLEDRRGDT